MILNPRENLQDYGQQIYWGLKCLLAKKEHTSGVDIEGNVLDLQLFPLLKEIDD